MNEETTIEPWLRTLFMAAYLPETSPGFPEEWLDKLAFLKAQAKHSYERGYNAAKEQDAATREAGARLLTAASVVIIERNGGAITAEAIDDLRDAIAAVRAAGG